MSLWDWIVYLYDYVRSIADNFISRVMAVAQPMIDAAKNSWLGTVWNTVSGWINSAYNSVVNALTPLINQAKSWAKPAWDWVQSAYYTVKNWIDAQLNPVKQYFTQKVQEAREHADAAGLNAVETAKSVLNPKIDQVSFEVKGTEVWIANVDPFIAEQMGLFTIPLKERLTTFFNDQYPNLVAFFSSPLSFMLGALQEVFIDWFCFVLAYALGTVNASLPPWPAFDRHASGGAAVTPPAAASGLFQPLATLYITGYRFTSNHPGTDYGCLYNEPVYASHAGVVEFAGWTTVGYGVCITIRGADWWSRYGHLISTDVQVGQEVHAGQKIGGGDTTGNSTGNHLHYELKYKGQFINPETVF